MASAAISQTNNHKGTHYSVLGQIFSTYEAAEKWRDATIARREAYAGRELSDYELVHGLKRSKDDRDLLTRIDENAWRMTPTPSNQKPPHTMDDRSYLTALRGERRETPKDLERRAKADYDARMSRENPAAPDAEREAAQTYALDLWERIAFSDAPQSHLAFANRIREQAAGDLTVFREMSEQFSALTQIRNAEVQLGVAAERQRVEQRLSTLPTIAPFSAAKAHAADPDVGDRILRMRDLDGNVSYRVVNGNEVKQQWAEADAPAEIVEAAQ
ncbi:hypothetical protein [Lacipirellula parvula]|uniref:Uncharacterized protein n=1 Tax=Lacipirellula parvula TaxID=2650471 RepID=A0A5K7XCC2_9BACT|nr:hypothetical protein [Lacipirellula parvula]BBO34470.1 hypothetical protein PLANPX_4082 [Lacipirellula parvula]